ncbi:MAG TPA: hypothetical protein VF846_00035 [Thermoanaerobaculia bacterium]
MTVQPHPKAIPAAASVFAGRLINVQITVDTNGILANPAVGAGQVIFMTDNNAAGGSSGEGTFELNTACNVGDIIQWRLAAQDGHTSLKFLGMKNSNGNVFGFNPPVPEGPSLYQGTVTATGQETYQILILVAGTTTYSWDPYITCN